ncbi:MFS transporter [Paenibacillus antri]|uniref:MFS transporter n=1 Tax=Paenibacillus antri TaxID=2582848 RepID=UPI0013053B79|nr:MFS transporter [Paenibacillus antri]
MERLRSSPFDSRHRNRWSILQIVNMGTLISTLDVGIVNVTLPTMSEQFGVSLSQIQWVATAYLLTMVALLPFMGKLSDRLDRRKIYSWGFLLFSVGSACIALSDGLVSILLSRILQGVGATMIMANSQAMVRQLFPDRERGRALGMNAVVISIGTMSGPALGGLMLEVVEWPWLFWINVPIGLCAFVLGLRWFPSTERGQDRSPFDFLGSFLLAAGTCLLMFAAEAGKENGFTTPILYLGAAGLVLFAALWFVQRKIAYGILDRELFGRRKIALGNASSFFINLAQTATLIPIAFYLQGPLGLSPWSVGLLLIVQPLLMGVAAPIAGWVRDRFGAWFPITAGSMLCAASMLFIAALPNVTVVGIALQLALFGIGVGLFHATNNAEIMSDAPDRKISLAGSLLAMVRYLGNIAGIGLATLLVGSMTLGDSLRGGADESMDLRMRMLFGICFLFCLGVAGMGKLRPKDKPATTEIGA